MPEPTSSAAGIITVATAAVSTSALTVFGVPLGLRVDLLIAGFAGALVAIILLDSVPGSSDTWRELARTTVRRIAVAFASSLTAGYLTPLAMLIAAVPESLLLGSAFAVGGGAQQILSSAIRRFSGQAAAPPAPPSMGGTP
ncbi:hypothetical protein [Acidovorax sp. NCPPB 4044]|uniref:hypothetical protein n=1 Tax=Acidovorax sp. NCPPB 4044 TaxID=2940490 RepID=UPI0023024314|nr:hypothetical protein [Acidovorax sp. NCPPB 4044]MDA8522299.1 hypothetical protein [Acidovorax sp. NCPPB 4044]